MTVITIYYKQSFMRERDIYNDRDSINIGQKNFTSILKSNSLLQGN